MALTRRLSFTEADRVESMLRNIDESTINLTGTSLFHVLTVASIAVSIGLFASGKKMAALFVGLWPATFQALKSASQRH
jgi:hypothetical protein